MFSLKRYTDRVALVTGAAQGIGAAVAERLGSEDAAVVLVDLNAERVELEAARLRGAGIRAHAVQCNVAQAADVARAVDEAAEVFGRLDVLVTSAGITRDNLLFRMSESEWDAVVDVHLKGTFLCIQAAQRFMVEQRYGKIVAISSRAALGNYGQANYSAAKAGIIGLARTAAIELGPRNINVNVIAPGHIETAMTHGIAEQTGTSYDEVKRKAIEINSIKRVGQPADIAAAAAYLASEEAGYVTGQVLYVAGRPVS